MKLFRVLALAAVAGLVAGPAFAKDNTRTQREIYNLHEKNRGRVMNVQEGRAAAHNPTSETQKAAGSKVGHVKQAPK